MPIMPIAVRPLHPGFGAEVSGLDLSRRPPSQVFRELTGLYARHRLLLLREQWLTPAMFAVFARRWGTPRLAPPGSFDQAATPAVMRVARLDNAMILCSVVAPGGGETIFSSACEAHDPRPERVYRHRWTEGDLMLWDEHRVLHGAERQPTGDQIGPAGRY